MTTGQGAGVCSLWFDPAGVEPDDAICAPNLSEDGQATAAKIASDVLYVLTNRHWPGTCPRVVRPAFQHDSAGAWCWAWWGPDPDPRYPIGWASPFRPVGGRVRASATLRLPGPVAAITRVRVDGTDLSPSAYLLQGTRTLLRVDGEDWPVGNDLTRAATTPRGDAIEPAWEIAYQWGAEPPEGATAAAEALYCQIAHGMTGSEECRLMWGVRLASVSRRGVNVSYESIADTLAKGLTGVDEVDLWVNSARGGQWRPRGGGRVRRADAPRRRSRWTV